MLHFTSLYTPNHCAIPAAVMVSCLRCENEECQSIHGFSLQIQLFWYSLVIDWMFSIGPPA